MKEGDQLAQFFAVFLPPHEVYKMFGAEDMPDEEYIATLRKYLLDNVAKHKDIIKMAYNADDIERNLFSGPYLGLPYNGGRQGCRRQARECQEVL